MYFCVVLRIVCFVTFYVLFVCKCLLYYCHRVSTQLQLNISYRIISYIKNVNAHIEFQLTKIALLETRFTHFAYPRPLYGGSDRIP